MDKPALKGGGVWGPLTGVKPHVVVGNLPRSEWKPVLSAWIRQQSYLELTALGNLDTNLGRWVLLELGTPTLRFLPTNAGDLADIVWQMRAAAVKRAGRATFSRLPPQNYRTEVDPRMEVRDWLDALWSSYSKNNSSSWVERTLFGITLAMSRGLAAQHVGGFDTSSRAFYDAQRTQGAFFTDSLVRRMADAILTYPSAL